MKKTMCAALGLMAVATTTAGSASAAVNPWNGNGLHANNDGTVQVAVDDRYSDGHGWCDHGVPSFAIAVRSLSGTRPITVIEEKTYATKTVTVGTGGAVVTMPQFKRATEALTVHVFDGPLEGQKGTGNQDIGTAGLVSDTCAGLPSSPPSVPASWAPPKPGVSVASSSYGVKKVNSKVYATGTVTRVRAGTKVCSQVLVKSKWATSSCGTTSSSGAYRIPLTYGAAKAGKYTFRVLAADKYSSNTFSVTRTR